MKKHSIIVVDNGLTEEQKCGLISLEFVADNSTPIKWIYNAMDTQDLVMVAEDFGLDKRLNGVLYTIKWGDTLSLF